MSAELKSCPFCNSRTLKIEAPLHFYVVCLFCSAEGPLAHTRDQAITAWNTRAGEKV